MELLPKSKDEFNHQDYWESFFKKLGGKAFEWYGEYMELSQYFHKYMKFQDDILIVGCGNSALGKDLYDVGFQKIINIDISKVAIHQMLSQNDKKRETLQYIQMDALHTTFNDNQFSVIIDKGTLDALMPNTTEETMKNIDQYFSEIQRLLRIGGRYLCISLLQEHILKKVLEYFSINSWMIRIVRCLESEFKSVENEQNSIPTFMIICTKFKSLPRQILEINLTSNGTIKKCNKIEEIMENIKCTQNTAFVINSLKKVYINKNTPYEEICVEVFGEDNESDPRFTVHVAERATVDKRTRYAAFIVPQGRETDWFFSTKDGRNKFLSLTDYSRLALISMHRGHKYESLEALKKELEDVVRNLAPANFKNQQIEILSLGNEIGKRDVKYEGESEFSGKYIIEDVEQGPQLKFRRLIFLKAQSVIQSEAKIISVKTRRKNRKDVVDLTNLMCQHHSYMGVATLFTCLRNESECIVLGLGGGGLCSFLHKLQPNLKITGIDIDPEMLNIAQKWFGFVENDKMKTKIIDGLDYIINLDKSGEKIDALLCDVDNKNTELGMSCPPVEFLSPNILNTISRILSDTGSYIVNIVIRDQSLRPKILDDLKNVFRTVASYKLDEELNEIFICTNMDVTNEIIKNNLKKSADTINAFFIKNKVEDINIDIQKFIDNLKIN